MGSRSFFVPPECVRDGRALLKGQVARQIRSVLRLKPGDKIDLLDGSGALYRGPIAELARDSVLVDVSEVLHPDTEPHVRLELYQSVLKGEKMDWVIQKGTEIGVACFVPVLSERCVSRPSHDDFERRRPRLHDVTREAAEQSGRTRLPEISPLVAFQDACSRAAAAGRAFVAWEGAAEAGLGEAFRDGAVRNATSSVAIMIGPEGGYSEREVALARELGVAPVGLGRLILRAETAAIVASTLVLCHLEEIG